MQVNKGGCANDFSRETLRDDFAKKKKTVPALGQYDMSIHERRGLQSTRNITVHGQGMALNVIIIPYKGPRTQNKNCVY